MTDTRRLYQQIADQVRQLITDGNYAPGGRLPAERELAQQLGVSRPSLREALIALEIDGSIEIRMGSGIYITNATRPAEQRSSLGESPTEMMQARAVIESAIILQASVTMTPAIIASLRQILADMAQEISQGRMPVEQDRQFHLTITDSVGNAVLSRIVANLVDERHSPISDRIRGHFETVTSWKAALDEHEAILAALESGNPLLAQSAMHAHLIASGRRWIEGMAGL